VEAAAMPARATAEEVARVGRITIGGETLRADGIVSVIERVTEAGTFVLVSVFVCASVFVEVEVAVNVDVRVTVKDGVGVAVAEEAIVEVI